MASKNPQPLFVANGLPGLAVGIVGDATPHDVNHPGQSAVDLSIENLASHGQVLAKVVIRWVAAWMLRTLNGDAWSGMVTCEVTLAGGNGTFGAPVTSPALVVDETGTFGYGLKSSDWYCTIRPRNREIAWGHVANLKKILRNDPSVDHLRRSK